MKEELYIELDNVNKSEIGENYRFGLMSLWFWISRCIIRNDKSIQNFDFSDFIGTGIVQLAILNKLLLIKGNAYYLITKEPLVENDAHTTFSYNFINVFIEKIYEFMQNPKNSYTRDLVCKASATNFNFVINSLARKKKQQIIVKYEYKFLYLLFKMFKYRSNVKDVARFIFWYFMPEKLLIKIKGYKRIENSDKERETFI